MSKIAEIRERAGWREDTAFLLDLTAQLVDALKSAQAKARQSIPSAIGFTSGDLQDIVIICGAALRAAGE